MTGATVSKIRPSVGEEIANAITHGVGALLAITGLSVLLIVGAGQLLVGFLVYGTSLILLYLASTLYHALFFTRARRLFRKLDHMAIFVLIAGTYTPFCVAIMDSWLGWTLLGTVWLLAIAGIVLKSVFTGRFEWISLTMYILTGWIAVFAILPIYELLSLGGFLLLIGGGLAYTCGVYFYVKSSKPYFHSIWHLWVLAGSVLHYFSILSLTAL